MGPTVATGGIEWDAQFVPDSDRIVLNDASKLWFVRAGRSVARFGVPAPIMILMGADSEQVMTMDFDGNLERWNIDQDHLRRLACQLVDRDLTEDEWMEFFPDETHRSTCGAASD